MALCTAELSLYPLANDYLSVIKGFINKLHGYPELEIVTTTTSTQVRGEYSHLFAILAREIETLHETTGQAILVCKFLAGEQVAPGLYKDE
ncbi:YkoF family thiamine/hydroxymethylpyrimidine-binding protein [Alteromonas flava]|uniref:YkoF family thiamine/hydroxymethylpyrimidine-binding protein n=1 Tax=Alteromonas flava TaxID=2048003 RepID=UPI000C28BCF9|nr:YkoF family thiamine/hydroxymethylpyrimidine-binding protein [Alteromonas flava]